MLGPCWVHQLDRHFRTHSRINCSLCHIYGDLIYIIFTYTLYGDIATGTFPGSYTWSHTCAERRQDLGRSMYLYVHVGRFVYPITRGPYNMCTTFLYGGLPYNQLRGHVIHVYMYSQVCDYMMYGGPYMGVLWHTSYMGEFYITWRNARMAEDPGASRHFHSILLW